MVLDGQRIAYPIHPDVLASVIGVLLKGGGGVFWDCVIRECWNKLPLEMSSSPFQKSLTNAVVAIDTRPNMMTVMSVRLTLSHVDTEKTWRGAVMFCKPADADFYTTQLGPIAQVIPVPELDIPKFDMDDYNDFMKCTLIWDLLDKYGVEKALLVQDDGFLVRSGVEAYLAYDYIGAPWRNGQDILAKYVGSDLVGNGGLSLRSVPAMLNIARTVGDDAKKERFHTTLVQTPEDVFFVMHARRLGYSVCPRGRAFGFASEQVARRGCCGVHKPWPYMSVGDVESLFKEARRSVL
jgi:hypothetical protein